MGIASTAPLGTLGQPRNTKASARQYEFERLATAARRRARTFALRLTHSRDDAEDLVQDTLLRAWRGYGTFRPDRPFVNWILRIMERTFLDARRRDNPIRRAASLNGLISPATGEAQEIQILDPSPGPFEAALETSLHDAMLRTLVRLPEPYRTAVLRCDIDKMSYAEIAAREGTTVGTVRSRIHRGRRLLQQSLRKHFRPE